ncbi:MAG TPA: hypothetical protein VL068_01665 [Microthrixaceae bacterium]|nr:hypothetical protein [Microthrixaceae bacterium]
MSNRRWYNPHLPQTLVIAQFLLYLDAAFGLIRLLSSGSNSIVTYTSIGRILFVSAIVMSVFGAHGIANEKKLGYQVAVAASFMPLLARVVLAAQASGVISNLGYVLFSGNVLYVLFEYALIALLLHPMSHNHQKIWFS